MTPQWLEAQKELARLEARMAELEAHKEAHYEDRAEFESCDVCDTEYCIVETQIEQHIATWAATWARQAVELRELLEQLTRTANEIYDSQNGQHHWANPLWVRFFRAMWAAEQALL
jgi:hypothetical protein